MDDNELREKTVDSTNVYDGVLLHVYRDTVMLPNGHKSKREYIKHNGAVCIVALTDEGKVLVEHQYRYPFSSVITELPAGKLDSADEIPLEAAKRELREETGYSASTWRYLGPFAPTVAYSSEVIHMYLATGLSKGERDLDDDEFLNVIELPLSDLKESILRGEIPDGKTIAAVLMADALR